MKNFEFPLDRVLEWRQTQLEMEEAKFRRELEAVASLDRDRAALEAAEMAAEVHVRNWRPVAGRDVIALGGYRTHVQAQEEALAGRRAQRQRELEKQQSAMLEARRRCRLLERLKTRRREEWQTAEIRELEELAAESFLAGWARGER